MREANASETTVEPEEYSTTVFVFSDLTPSFNMFIAVPMVSLCMLAVSVLMITWHNLNIVCRMR
jgi:hypothetical protein